MAPKPVPVRSGSGIAIGHATAEVGNARARVDGQDLQRARVFSVAKCLHDQLAAAGVLDEVARGLGHQQSGCAALVLVESQTLGQAGSAASGVADL